MRSVLVAIVLAGCAGAPPRAAPSASASSTAPAPPPRPWAELDHQERAAHMARHVLPVAGDLFRGWQPERYRDFSCETCHGEEAASRGFAMPSPSLVALYPTGSIGQRALVARNPDAAAFMFRQVLPAMRTMVGGAEYDPATHTGFSCYSCHPRAADDDPLSQPAP